MGLRGGGVAGKCGMWERVGRGCRCSQEKTGGGRGGGVRKYRM